MGERISQGFRKLSQLYCMAQKNDLPKLSRRVAYLIERFNKGTITTVEHDELDAWVEESDANADVFEELMNDDPNFEPLPDEVKTAIRADERQSVLRRIFIALGGLALLAIIFIGYEYIHSRNIRPAPAAVVLQLGDGSTLVLNDVDDGQVAIQNGTILKKMKGGELLYEAGQSTAAPFLFNKLSTWKGGQYTVVLPDGSRVTLNAESSLHYPTRFPGEERIVELDGEAYFEVVAKMDSSTGNNQPFIVKLNNGAVIKSLTAHFNVSSYQDDSISRVTLFQGDAEVQRGNQNVQLHSNQQASFSDSLTVGNNVDMNEVIGWKYGEFVFHDANIETVMRQINRWYTVRITGEPVITARFNITAPRNQVLSKLLDQLEATGNVHFKVTGRHVYVLR